VTQEITWSSVLDDFTAEGSDPPLLAHAAPDEVCLVKPCTDHRLFCCIVSIHECSK
jgi:hypothetical protein